MFTIDPIGAPSRSVQLSRQAAVRYAVLSAISQKRPSNSRARPARVIDVLLRRPAV